VSRRQRCSEKVDARRDKRLWKAARDRVDFGVESGHLLNDPVLALGVAIDAILDMSKEERRRSARHSRREQAWIRRRKTHERACRRSHEVRELDAVVEGGQVFSSVRRNLHRQWGVESGRRNVGCASQASGQLRVEHKETCKRESAP
jgi:hypothetical protein